MMFWRTKKPGKEDAQLGTNEAEYEPSDVADGPFIFVAVVAIKFPGRDSHTLSWAWTTATTGEGALGAALKNVPSTGMVAGWTVIEIPLASAIEARSGETGSEADGLDPKDESAVPKGDAQNG